MSRSTREETFFEMAYALAKRGTCERLQVGCLIVIDGRPAGGGYNGSLGGQPHCIDDGVGCDIGPDGGCQRTVHAEANAIAWAARHGVKTQGAVLYVTNAPCIPCSKLIVQAQFKEVWFREPYRAAGIDLLMAGGVYVFDSPGKI